MNFIESLIKYANTSIDISDGLVADLNKMINNQNLTYKINIYDVPVSSYLLNLMKNKKLNKSNLISRGDDYQILFTANSKQRRIIQNISKSLGIKITKIGKINSGKEKNTIIDRKGKKIHIKNRGYTHQF